jgi:hypothetical protein
MATVTWNVSKDARIADNGGTSLGAGASDFNPTGYYSGFKYRTLLGFSYSFSGMVSITSAILWMKSSTQNYVAFGSDPDVTVRRLSSSWSEGTSVSMSGSNAVDWDNQPGVTGSTATGDMTTSELTWDSIDITTIIQEAFAANQFYGLRCYAPDEGSSADVWEMCSREYSTSSDPYIVVTYTTNTAPNAPTGLTPTADTVVTGLTPTFQGTFSDPDAGDLMANAQVIVYADDGVTQIWDSGSFAATGTTFSKVYSGTALTGNTFYKWKGRTADDDGAWGAYSALQRFKVNSTPNAPSISLTESPTTDVKTLTPTFNITHNDPDASDSQMTGYTLILETSGGSAVWNSGDVTVTATVSKAVTYAGPALSWQTGYRWRARTKDSNGAWGAYSTNATFTTHTAGVPISLSPSGGITASSITPTFTGSRATSADSLTSAQIKVYASDGTTLVWDSGTFTTGVTSTGFSKIYAGTALSASTTYKWQARVTSSVGGTSAYSALQTFVTPDTNTPSGDAPVGSGITPVTNLQFTFSRGTNFNIHQLYLYSDSGGTVQVTSDTPVAYTATGTKTFTYSGTLSWNTTYWWKVRVSSDGGSNWSPYTGLIQFTTDAAGIPTLGVPADASWLGAPRVIDEYDDITGITNGTSAASSLETGAGLFQTGIGSLKIALTTLAASTTSFTYRTVAMSLSNYGPTTPLYIYSRISSLTNVSTMRLKFRFATDSDFASFNIIPSVIDTWEQKSLVLGTPTATGGTVDWSNVTRIGVEIVSSGGGSVTANAYVDDLKLDAINPAFTGTTFNSEVISTYRIRVYAADQTTLVWDSGDLAGSGTTFSKLYAGSALSKGVTYYWQARYVKSTGPTGEYSALRSFVINSDPTVPTGLSPSSGAVVADSIVPHFIATYNDVDKAALGDYPTYMEVEVYRNSDSVLAYQLITKTGLVAAANEIYDGLSGTVKVTGAAAPIAYETEYKYRVRYYDSKGARGSWSSYTTFKPSQSPTSTITSPSNLGTVGSPSFNITFSISSPGSKGQNAYRARIIRVSDAVTLVDTGQVYSSSTTYVMPAGYLTNGNDYDIEVTLWDTDGLSGVDTNRVTANWTAPDPIVDFTVTDDVSLSATVLQWEQSNLLSTDFRKYVIYRKESSDTDWTVLTELTNQTQVLYYDYTAANTVSYEYKITQYQIVPGDVDLESGDSDIGTSTLDTDSWFVVGADRSALHIFELPVAAGPFAEPVQQEVFEPLGTNRKVIVRGKTLGAEGSMQVRWKDSERVTAVEQVDYIKSNAGPHILKSPFGDIWYVEFSGPTKDYLGGGHMNVTLVWTEVE